MMSKTHLAIGTATAVAISTASTPLECAVCVAGGALGGVIADVDILDNDYNNDALIGEAVAFGLIIVMFLIDLISGMQMIHHIIDNGVMAIIGLIGFVVLWIIGYNSNHRNFTHSILAHLLFTICVALIMVDLAIPFFLGYFSHLLIDFFNKKGIQLFFPFKCHICLGWVYAKGAVNTALMWIGLLLTIIFLVMRLI